MTSNQTATNTTVTKGTTMNYSATDLSFSSISDNLPNVVKKNLLRSITASLNWSVINFVRMHCRKMAAATAEGMGGIDVFNDAMSAIDAMNESEANRAEQGHEMQVDPLELGQHYYTLRNYCDAQLKACELQERMTVGFVPVAKNDISLGATLKQMIRPVLAVDEQMVASTAAATGISPEHLRQGELRRANASRAETIKLVPAILDEVGRFTQHDSADDADAAFDALPFVRRMQVMAKALKQFETQLSYAAVDYQNGREDALGNYQLLLARKKELLIDIGAYIEAHPTESLLYADMMPTFDLPVSAKPTVVTAPVIESAPVEHKVKRVKKQDA